MSPIARSRLLRALKIAVSAGLIAFLVARISPRTIASSLGRIDGPYLVAASAVFFLSSLLGALQWRMLLDGGGVPLSFRRAFQLYFVGLFFNNFLPANVGGDAVKIFDVVHDGNDPHRVFAVTLLDRVAGITALCLLALAASTALLPLGVIDNLPVYMLVFAGCILPVALLAANRRLSGGVRRLLGQIRFRGIGERIDSVVGHLGGFRAMRSLMIRAMLLAMTVQALRVATHVLVGRALGVTAGAETLLGFYVIVPLLGLVMTLPISLNGLGVREGTGVVLFAGLGIAGSQAFLMEFITYVVQVAVSLLGGLFFLARQLGRR
ncbi:MAG: flippase-like domain-containing protein [Candidatus Krumholzibacteriota bacterium]|nr:flippase-like domain-containing protein [Candidatus Krumholzibacteriota bacterium]